MGRRAWSEVRERPSARPPASWSAVDDRARKLGYPGLAVSASDYASDDGPTYPEHQAGLTTALLIGATREILERASAAGSLMQVYVIGTDVAQARSMVTRFHPRVILIQEDVFEFDPVGFKALAMSGHALLFRLPSGDLSLDTIELALARSLGRSGTRPKR